MTSELFTQIYVWVQKYKKYIKTQYIHTATQNKNAERKPHSLRKKNRRCRKNKKELQIAGGRKIHCVLSTTHYNILYGNVVRSCTRKLNVYFSIKLHLTGYKLIRFVCGDCQRERDIQQIYIFIENSINVNCIRVTKPNKFIQI